MRTGWWLFLAGCAGDMDSDEPAVENIGPTLVHEVPGAAYVGHALPLAVSAVDPDGVEQVIAYYRTPGETVWDTVFLERTADLWTGAIPEDAVESGGLEYYFRAQDASELRVASFAPEAAETAPFEVVTTLVAEALPYETGFEDTSASGLYNLGWNEASESFPGARWAIGTSRVYTGGGAMSHGRGADGTGLIRDWLISPPLDFSTLDNIELSWAESGDYVELANHELWIATESGELGDESWVWIADLPVPLENDWSPSAIYDLSEWAGDSSVWLAWVYEGEEADVWHLDELVVRERRADLSVSEAEWSPNPAAPGDVVNLSFEVNNASATASAPLQVRLRVDQAYGVAGPAVDVAGIDGDSSAQWTVGLTLRDDLPLHSYVPFLLEATDGETVWTWSQKMVVGHPSSAAMSLSRSGQGVLRLTLGVGDPESPDWELPVVSGVVSETSLAYTVDITDAHDFLPPAPGELRWWLRVESDVTGTLDAFGMEWNEASFVSADLGSFSAGETYFYLPKPAEPMLLGATTSPNPVQAGNTVTWSTTLYNSGAATTGPTWVTLESSDPDVVILTDEPILLGNPWSPGGQVVPFQFQVSSDHRDSTPVDLELHVVDDADSWVLPALVAVPWPVLRVSRLGIDDFGGGDNDGILDGGETVEIEVSLTNQGLRDTFGAVACVLSQVGGTATSDIEDATGNFGTIGDGTTAVEDDFEVSVSGQDGQNLDFRLTCNDGTVAYEVDFELILGEAIWLDIDAIGDPSGDAANEYTFDIVGGRYRSDGITLEIELESAEPYNPGTLFVESWMVSDATPYAYYQLVAQSGVGSLRGYDGNFHDLSDPVVTAVDDTHVRIEIDIASMDLALPAVSAGFATGFCGGSNYYCDHFPNGWGNPYQTGMITSLFADMNW